MKVRVIQPPYSINADDIERCYQKMLALMDECNEPLDLIVLPEYCDIPAAQQGGPAYFAAFEKYTQSVLQSAVNMAKRCRALTFVNCASKGESGYRNTTYAIDRAGNIVGKYYKAHPAPKEDKPWSVGGIGMDSSYSHCGDDPYILELEGLRFGFMTCYDFYMYEAFAPLALQKVDIVIGCSHQRTDTHEALSVLNRFLAYNTNAYLVRASVSMGEDSPVGGCSCVIAPSGEELLNLKNRAGYGTCEIDPQEKYYKKAGFRGGVKPHYEYIEEGRRPWLYRNGGKGIVAFDKDMPYPRLCAHRGQNTVAPENTLPAYSMAVALGAEEIEFDLRLTKDGVLVASHEYDLSLLSDGTGHLNHHTYAELKKLDFGVKFDPKFKGVRIPTFEEILRQFAGRAIMNIHVKIWDVGHADCLPEIVSLLKKYDCVKHCYFMTGNDEAIKEVKAYDPTLRCCMGAGSRAWEIVDRAIAAGAEKVQLYKPYFNQEMIDKAHAHGIKCNAFWSDDPEEAKAFLRMGVDTILTNDYLGLKTALASEWEHKK